MRGTANLFLIALLCLCCLSGLSLIHSDAADERSSVDLGGRRTIKKQKYIKSII